MKQILVINGSYRDDGVIDQLTAEMIEVLQSQGAQCEEIRLRDYPIDFCLNCRACTQTSGVTPGHCVLKDGMAALVDKIEASEAYILASPTNFGSVTAIFKRFIERLTVYGYWPWGAPAPKMRKSQSTCKPALLIVSSAAPSLMARWAFSTHKQLKQTAQIIGAKPVGQLLPGMVAATLDQPISDQLAAQSRQLALKLL